MSLNRLTVRAKKSFSGLFSFGEVDNSNPIEANKHPRNDKENTSPELEEFRPLVSCSDYTFSDTKSPSPIKNSPLRRKRLLGSLRRISSLRSIRSSPSKTQDHDESPLPPESPRTPTRYVRNSLALNFKESPPGEPMFDMPKPRRSISSSLFVHHSSPIFVPRPNKQDPLFGTPVNPAILPAGTIPTTPAPLQRALEMEAAGMTPSTGSSPVQESSVVAEPLPTPMPGTNLAFDDIRPDIVHPPSSTKLHQIHSGYFDIPLSAREQDEAEDAIIEYDRKAAHTAGAEDLDVLLPSHNRFVDQTCDDMGNLVNKGKRTTMYHPADGGQVERLSLRSQDDPDEKAIMDNVEHIIYEDDNIILAGQEKVSNAAADANANRGSAEHDQAETERRISSWGQHTGLYDGTGYGEGSSSRPSISAEDPTENSETIGTSEEGSAAFRVRHEDAIHANVVVGTEPGMRTPGDQETLEAVIRAYAAYENEGSSSVTDEEIAEEIDLANRMMNNSLGA